MFKGSQVICLEEVITKTAELFFQVLLGIELQYCKAGDESWILLLFFLFRHFLLLLSWVYFDYFEAFFLTLINWGRDEVEVSSWAEVHKIAVIYDSENKFGGNDAPCKVGYKLTLDKNFDDPHRWVGVIISLRKISWQLMTDEANIHRLSCYDSVEILLPLNLGTEVNVQRIVPL